MTEEHVDKYFGIPMSEWIDRIPNELEADAVGLWQIVTAGKDNFDLAGEDLKSFVKLGILALLKKGARPVAPSQEPGKFWELNVCYGENPNDIAENIVGEWLKSETDPDEDGLWFALLEG